METILEDFTTRAANLKEALLVRSSSLDPTIQTTITELERRVANCRYLMEQEQQAVQKAWELLDQLDSTTASLIHMRDHLPKHLPRKPLPRSRSETVFGKQHAEGQSGRDVEVDEGNTNAGSQRGGMVGAVGSRTPDRKRSIAQNIGQSTEDSSADVALNAPDQSDTIEKKAKMNTTILPVTVAEFDTIPKYIRK